MKTLKKLLTCFVIVFALVAVVACTNKPTCEHTNVGTWEGDENSHWHLCKDCNAEVDKAAHTFGEWEVVTNAAVGFEGLKKRVCSVCSYYETDVIPAVVVNTGTAAADMVVYAKVPADWATAYCYFWGDEIDSTNTVGWPGKEMTLVDAEQNIWGFIVPKGTANIIFNNNAGTQTADLLLALDLNLYTLTELNANGQYLADYAEFTAPADQPELNKYPTNAAETFKTIYVQLPTDWAAQNIHHWGSGPATNWPGNALTAVDAENGVYSYELSSTVTGIIFNNNAGAQTADIVPNEAVNGYVVTVDAEGKVSYTECTYAEGVFTPVVVERTIVFYVLGTMNSWTANDDYKLVVTDTTATITIALVEGDEFKVADSTWTPQFGYSADLDTTNFADNDGNIKCLVAGEYVITITNYNTDDRAITIVLVPAAE